MKRTQHKLTKTQRKARSKRKTWTNAEKKLNRKKNRARLADAHRNQLRQFMQNAQQEMAHIHHDHEHKEEK